MITEEKRMNRQYLMSDIMQFMESFAPQDTAEQWDNVGLMLGDPETEISGIVISLDPSRKAIALCMKEKCNLLITHHPLFFHPCDRIDYSSFKGAIIRDAILQGVSVFSAHTNLDKARGGVNDALAEKLSLSVVGPLQGLETGLHCRYTGNKSYFSIAANIQDILGAPGYLLNSDQDTNVEDIFLVAGAFDENSIPFLRGSGIRLVITGEMKHHHMVELMESGISVIAAGHESTERVVIPVLKNILQKKFPALAIHLWMGNDFSKVKFQ
jgi:dinuclear metal center YbgI/SA1388 family protein